MTRPSRGSTCGPVNLLAKLLMVASCLGSAACGTFLSFGETTPGDYVPKGLVVNLRTVYDVKVSVPDDGAIKKEGFVAVTQSPSTQEIRGVAEDRVLTLNVCRMPFATGELSVELTGDQVLKKVTLAGETGVYRALQAATSLTEATTDVMETLEAPTTTTSTTLPSS